MSEHVTTTFHDATGLQVGELSSDHIWLKTVLTSWKTTVHGVGSNCLSDSSQSDSDLGVYFRRIQSDRYLPTWCQLNGRGTAQEKTAAAKSALYNDTSSVIHFDSSGLSLRQLRRLGDKVYTQAYRYDFAGNRIQVFDSQKRLVEHNFYDMKEQSFLSRGIDNGDC